MALFVIESIRYQKETGFLIMINVLVCIARIELGDVFRGII